MGEPRHGGTAQADYRADRVRRALTTLRPVLGPRFALVGDSRAELPGCLARIVLAGAERAAGPRVVVGAPGAVPLLSGSLTGVVLADGLLPDAAAARALSEVTRMLQPGGCLLLLARVALDETVSEARSFGEIAQLLRAAGLELGRRVVCHATPSRVAGWVARLPRPLWGVGAALERLAARLGLARPVEITGVLAARKAGGLEVPYPDLRRMLGGMLIPPRWLEKRRSSN